MKKRFIALLLCMQMIISLLVPGPVAFAADDEEMQEGAQQEATVATSSDTVDSVLTEDDEFVIVTDGEETDIVEDEASEAVEGEETDIVEDEASEAVEGEESDVVEDEESEAVEGEESDVVEDEETEIVEDEEAGVIGEEAVAAEEEDVAAAFAWVEYEDFVVNEAEKAMADHGLYVGHTAVFNLDYCQSFYCAAEFDESGNAINPIFVEAKDFFDAQGNSYRVKIIDYHYEASYGSLWYKVEALEGETLPEFLQNNPYVAYYDAYSKPALLMQPRMAMFAVETVWIQRQMEMASRYAELNTADLPDFFEVTPMYEPAPDGEPPVWDGAYNWYDLGDVTAWAEALAADPTLRYVAESAIVLIPAEVTAAYEKLLGAESPEAYDEIYSTIPESVRQQLTDKHVAHLEGHREYLEQQAITEYSTSVVFGEVTLPISVKGKIPKEGVTLTASPVYADQLAAEGFGFSATDLITALDIKILNDDGTEWQPEDGNMLNLTIGVADLGCVEGQVVTLYHKHNGHISKNDLFVVMNGQLDICIPGFSIIAVTAENSTTTVGTAINSGGSATLTIGVPVVYYFQTDNDIGTWSVNDPSGSIHYTVHANVASSASIGNGGVRARWIKIVPLKVTTQDITLSYSDGENTETFKIKVQAPAAGAGDNGVKLYLKDNVNQYGKITATLVDEQRKELSTEGVAFSWSRKVDGLADDDPKNTKLIVPYAYEDSGLSVNIARDHGGLVEARKTTEKYLTVTYTCVATLVDGTTRTANYTVYYQSEIINAGFEFPVAATRNYSFFPNGYPELYWKTTAPGIRKRENNNWTNNITKDVEYGNVAGLTAGAEGNTNYGVWKGAEVLDPRFNDEGSTMTANQFAELNAEEVGALYQDIITVPGEDIEWDFAHAKRPNQSWASNVQNKMYLVIGPTENAQALSNDQLNALVRAARTTAGQNNTAFNNCQTSVEVTYQGAIYRVWYHNADNQTNYSASSDYGWAKLEGSYTVPNGQYRTRLFFVSDPDSGASNTNAGNLIDTSTAGQYRTYLIEYYVQRYDGTNVITEHVAAYDETGEELIYSSKALKNYNHFIVDEHDFLYKILINGENSPYDLRYSGNAQLYIDKYTGTPTKVEGAESANIYGNYDIVMQVFFRDTIVGVQKELKLPAALTEEQKLGLMDYFNSATATADKGYQATMFLEAVTESGEKDSSYDYTQTSTTSIVARDPAGNYKSYIAMGETMLLNHHYQLTETAAEEIPGLVLTKVTISGQRYRAGETNSTDLKIQPEIYERTINDAAFSSPLKSKVFYITNNNTDDIATDDVKIADITVINEYSEKMTTVKYVAVGNGKLRWADSNEFVDAPEETLKFYSGKARGAVGIAGKNATFMGWYKDAACTQPVTAADGVYDKNAMSFKPNTNIISTEVVTFYAKFETGSIKIQRNGGEPGQTYVYHVERAAVGTLPKLDLYVSVTCGADGRGYTEILELPSAEYTVTEVQDWSWRYDPKSPQTKNHASLPAGTKQLLYEFDGPSCVLTWLNGLSEAMKNSIRPTTTQ